MDFGFLHSPNSILESNIDIIYTNLLKHYSIYPFNSRDLISKSPYCLPHSFSFDVSLENLVLDQLVIPYLMVFFFLVTCLLDILLIV